MQKYGMFIVQINKYAYLMQFSRPPRNISNVWTKLYYG